MTDKLDLIDIYRTPYSAFRVCIPPQSLFHYHGTFTKIENLLDCKASLNKFQRIEIIPRMFSDFSGIKLKSVTEG